MLSPCEDLYALKVFPHLPLSVFQNTMSDKTFLRGLSTDDVRELQSIHDCKASAEDGCESCLLIDEELERRKMSHSVSSKE